MFQERAGHHREMSLGNSGIGVCCLLPTRQDLGCQSPEEFAGKADKLMHQGVVTQQNSDLLRGDNTVTLNSGKTQQIVTGQMTVLGKLGIGRVLGSLCCTGRAEGSCPNTRL